MLESQERYFQYLAAKRFYEEASGDFTFYQEDPSDFTEDELREEALLRHVGTMGVFFTNHSLTTVTISVI